MASVCVVFFFPIRWKGTQRGMDNFWMKRTLGLGGGNFLNLIFFWKHLKISGIYIYIHIQYFFFHLSFFYQICWNLVDIISFCDIHFFSSFRTTLMKGDF